MSRKNNVVRQIDANEAQLNDLFKEVLDGLRDDINEAQDNVDRYLKAIEEKDGGLELYGPLHNSALSVKGSARDRQLKFLNTFKDRVTKKEAVQIAKELKSKDNGTSKGMSHTEMNKIIEELKSSGDLDRIDLDLEEDNG